MEIGKDKFRIELIWSFNIDGKICKNESKSDGNFGIPNLYIDKFYHLAAYTPHDPPLDALNATRIQIGSY